MALSLLSVGTLHVAAQAPSVDDAIKRGVSLYNFGHWAEARTEFRNARNALSPVRDRLRVEKIDYYLALCDMELRTADAESRMRRFLELYNGSSYTNEIQFSLGAYYCILDDTQRAEEELSKVRYESLAPKYKDKYDLRMGYMAFMKGDYDAAERYFGRIAPSSDYADHAVYYKSYMAYSRGDFDTARNGFNSLLKSPLYRDLMPFYLMQIDFKSGDYQAVADKGEELMSHTMPEQAVQIRRMMAESWFQLGDYGKAVKYMNDYKESGGEMNRVENYILGYSLYRQTFYSEAEDYLRAACGADDMLTQNASYNLADCYLRAGDKENAMRSFAMAASSAYDPNIAEDALFNYGKLQYELGGGVFNEAINVLSRYVELYPESERVMEARRLLIAAYYNSHNYAEAYHAIRNFPNPDADAMQALQKIAYFNGLESYVAGDLGEAESSLEESLGVGLNAKYNALASFWLGEIAYASGDTSTALQRYRNFMARAPRTGNEYAMAQYNIGYCYFNNDEYAAAGEAFDKFLSLYSQRDSYRADALNRLGDVHYASRQFDDAIKCYDAAAALGTAERYYSQFQRAVTLGAQNNVPQKIESLQRIVQQDRGDYVDAATYELGRTYIGDAQYEAGVKVLERFVGQYPNSRYHAQALSDLGLAYMNLGDRDKALKYYDMVVKAAPQSSQSKSAMQGIRDIYIAQGDVDAYFDYARKTGLEGNMSEMTRDSLSYTAAQKLYLDNKTTEAAASFTSYLSNFPKGYYRNDALFYLSDCHIRDGRNDEAIKSLAELAAQGHTQYSERVLDRLSSMYYEAGQYEQAAGAFRSLYDEASTSAAKINAASGYVASTLKYADDNGIMAMADDVASMAEVNDTARRKAEFAKAQVLQRQGRGDDAMAIYEKLSDEVRSAEGAESRYRLIEAQYAAKNYDRAEKMIYEFSDSKTPQNYWLAKAFILLGDIYMSRGDSFQARATYQSVVDGYSPADDGIVEEAKSKIAKID